MEVTNPVKLDDITLKKLEDAFLLGCSIREACFVANISQQTYFNWVKSFPELKERFEQLKENPIYVARKSVVESLPKNSDLALKFLERKLKNEFSLKTETEQSGAIQIQISQEVAGKYETNTKSSDNSEG